VAVRTGVQTGEACLASWFHQSWSVSSIFTNPAYLNVWPVCTIT